MKPHKKDTYQTWCKCLNCEERHEYNIEVGKQVKEEECLNCGCKTLVVDL